MRRQSERVDFDYLSLNTASTWRPGRGFEHYVRHLLEVLGCRNITFTGAEGTSEDGADFIANRDIEIFPGIFEARVWGVQCKCVRRPTLSGIESQLTSLVRLRSLSHVLLVLAVDPPDRLRVGLRNWANSRNVTLETWGKSDLDALAQRFDSLRAWLYDHVQASDSIDGRYFHHYYHLGPNHARALRLAGADNEWFPPSKVVWIPDEEKYEAPEELELQRPLVISRLEERARKDGQMFYDGPNTRLLDFRVTPTDQKEDKQLELRIGRLGWFDYSVFGEVLGRTLTNSSIPDVARYINLDKVAFDGNVRQSRLPNILDTAVTIVSTDKMITYSRRSGRVSASPGFITSSVAENIHELKDRSMAFRHAGELPPPFRTVIRGIAEELSPDLAQLISGDDIMLLGLAFDLRGWGVDLLFLVEVPLSFAEILQTCQQRPGKDFVEGALHAVPANRSSQEMISILSDPNWNPGGKASFIRAIEFLDAAGGRED